MSSAPHSIHLDSFDSLAQCQNPADRSPNGGELPYDVESLQIKALDTPKDNLLLKYDGVNGSGPGNESLSGGYRLPDQEFFLKHSILNPPREYVIATPVSKQKHNQVRRDSVHRKRGHHRDNEKSGKWLFSD